MHADNGKTPPLPSTLLPGKKTVWQSNCWNQWPVVEISHLQRQSLPEQRGDQRGGSGQGSMENKAVTPELTYKKCFKNVWRGKNHGMGWSALNQEDRNNRMNYVDSVQLVTETRGSLEGGDLQPWMWRQSVGDKRLLAQPPRSQMTSLPGWSVPPLLWPRCAEPPHRH